MEIIRDFSKGKKEELCRALNVLDDKEWKLFKFANAIEMWYSGIE